MADKLFLTPSERRLKIDSILEMKNWSWYRLAKEMNRSPTAVSRAFKDLPAYGQDNMRLGTIKALAIALGVTVGWLVDKRET